MLACSLFSFYRQAVLKIDIVMFVIETISDKLVVHIYWDETLIDTCHKYPDCCIYIQDTCASVYMHCDPWTMHNM